MKKVVRFINYLTKIEYNTVTSDGKTVEVFEFNHQPEEKVLKAWAKHFRNHYCLDEQIDILRSGTGLSKKDYLNQIKFPDKDTSLGRGIRSGDFSEILVADYIQFFLGFWVPRTRYIDKKSRDESTKGVDIIGFKFVEDEQSPNDILLNIESKAKFSAGSSNDKLQEAITHSAKDEERKAESLNAIKQRLLDDGKLDELAKVARFQNQNDKPYIYQSGAAAFVLKESFKNKIVSKCTTQNHPNNENIKLIVIKGENMTELVNKLYEYAADEA